MTITLADAARERGAQMRAAADRPRQRRNAEPAGSFPRVVVRARMQLREPSEGSSLLAFTGYASVTAQGYEMWDIFGPYTEMVSPGAFAKTLNQVDLDVPLVLAHDQLRRLARTTTGTLRLSEDDTGLLVEADLDPADLDVAYIAPKLRAGLVDEMSFAFRITRGSWSPDWDEFHIDEVDMNRGDVAIVGFGANPYTSAELRAQVQHAAQRERMLQLRPEPLLPLI